MRYALGVEYDGSDFRGWQNLGEGGPSVQASLEQALSSVADAPLQVVCAGRTDAGVHGQCRSCISTLTWCVTRARMLGTTTRLPRSIAVRWCVPVADDFHARFSARARRYRYRLLNREVRPALDRQTLSWERRALDETLMHAAGRPCSARTISARSVRCSAGRCMPGVSCSHCRSAAGRSDRSRSAWQCISSSHGPQYRRIVDPVGSGEKPVEWIAELLAGRDRTVAGPTAPPQGLVFLGPLYPDNWHLPAEVTL